MYSLLYNIYKEKSSIINIFLCFLAYFRTFHSIKALQKSIFARIVLKNCNFTFIYTAVRVLKAKRFGNFKNERIYCSFYPKGGVGLIFSKLRLPARASLWYTASVIIGRGIGFLLTPIFTHLLSERAYGLYSLYMSWVGIFTIISTLEISGAVYMRENQKSDDRDKLLRSACVLEFLLVASICALYFTFYRYFSTLTELGVFMSAVMFIQIFLSSIINLYLSASKFRYKYLSVFFINILTGVLPMLLGIVLIKVFNVRVYAKILAQLAVSLAVFGVLIYIIFKKEKSISPRVMLSLLRSALYHFPHYISIAVLSRADKLFVAAAYGEVALARYSIADTVGSLLIFMISAPLSALSPWILRKLSAEKLGSIGRVCDVGCRIILWLSLILLGFAPEIMDFLTPASYREALFAAYPIAVSAIPYFAFSVMSVAFTHGGGAKSSISSVIGGGASILLSYFFTKLPHFTYTSFVIPICYFLMLAVGVQVGKKRGISKIINLKKTLSLTLFCALIALMLFLLRENLLLRLATLGLCFIPLTFDFGRGAEFVRE